MTSDRVSHMELGWIKFYHGVIDVIRVDDILGCVKFWEPTYNLQMGLKFNFHGFVNKIGS